MTPISLQPFDEKRKGTAFTTALAAFAIVTFNTGAPLAQQPEDVAKTPENSDNSDESLGDKARDGIDKAGEAAKNFLSKDPDPPDRDIEFRIGTVLIGTSFAIFPWRNLYVDFGVAYKHGIEKGYELFGDTLPMAKAELGIEAGAMIGLGWDQAFARGVLLEKDELSWRAGLRYRTTAFASASASAVLFMPLTADVKAGSGTAVPIYGGVTWTYWFLPSKGTGFRWLSNLFNLGFFARLELGPEIGSYTTYVDSTDDIEVAVDKGLEGFQPKTTFPVVRPYYNFVVGLVI